MTLSDAARLAAMEVALRTMLAKLGDRAFIGVRFPIQSAEFADLPQTTWLELQGEMLVEPMNAVGDWANRLTGRGWIAALRAEGVFESPELRERAVSLRTVLKGFVKGRPLQGVGTDLWTLQARTGLSLNWLQNALDSRLLQCMWPEEHLDLDLSRGLRDIRIPARFGSKRLSGRVAGPFPDP